VRRARLHLVWEESRPTLCSDGLRDGARVTQAVGVDSSDDKQVNGVGKKARDRVCLHLHHVGYSLPCAACWLAVIEDDSLYSEYSIKCYFHITPPWFIFNIKKTNFQKINFKKFRVSDRGQRFWSLVNSDALKLMFGTCLLSVFEYKIFASEKCCCDDGICGHM